MRIPIAIATLTLAGLTATACDDRRQRVEETAAPGMEQDAAAPASGPTDIDVDTIQPGQTPGAGEIQPQTMPPVTPQGQQPPPERQQGQGTQPPPGGR